MDIDFIRQLVQQKRYTLSRHSDTRRARRSVTLQEIEAAIRRGHNNSRISQPSTFAEMRYPFYRNHPASH
jgi:hypothetical protein